MQTKLTTELVTRYRAAVRDGTMTVADCAKDAGVWDTTIRLALTGKTWRRAPGKPLTMAEINCADALDEAAVKRARQLAAQCFPISKIVANFSYRYSPRQISDAVRGNTWKHMTDPPPVQAEDRAMSNVDEKRAIAMREKGHSYAAIAKKLGIHTSTVYRAVKRHGR